MAIESRLEQNVLWIEIDNPPVNALSSDVLFGLISLLKRHADDDRVKVFVLGSKGRHFCAGADLKEQARASESGKAGPADHGVALYTALLQCPKPIIGAAHGAVVGAGLSLMGCCDIVIAADDTTVSLPEINVGVFGGISHAATIFGKSMLNYLALTGERVPIQRAASHGFCLEVVERARLHDEVRKVAELIAQKPMPAILATKRCMELVKGVGQLEGYAREHALSGEMRATKDSCGADSHPGIAFE